MGRSFLTILFAAALLSPPPIASAQVSSQSSPAPDVWVLTRVREGDTLIATAPFSNGVTVVARCSYAGFGLILAGLPEPADGSAASRQLIMLVGDDPAERSTVWTVASDRTAAFSRLPAPTARRLARGGRLQIIVPAAPGGRRTRYVMDLTESVSAVQQVLTHCGRPLADANDERLLGDGGDGLPHDIVWLRAPSLEFPSATVHGGASAGTVTLSCETTSEGRLSPCDIEHEFPARGGFGQAARRGVGTGRVGLSDDARAAGRVFEGGKRVTFTVNFRTSY